MNKRLRNTALDWLDLILFSSHFLGKMEGPYCTIEFKDNDRAQTDLSSARGGQWRTEVLDYLLLSNDTAYLPNLPLSKVFQLAEALFLFWTQINSHSVRHGPWFPVWPPTGPDEATWSSEESIPHGMTLADEKQQMRRTGHMNIPSFSHPWTAPGCYFSLQRSPTCWMNISDK